MTKNKKGFDCVKTQQSSYFLFLFLNGTNKIMEINRISNGFPILFFL